jgi:hypothetical protein
MTLPLLFVSPSLTTPLDEDKRNSQSYLKRYHYIFEQNPNDYTEATQLPETEAAPTETAAAKAPEATPAPTKTTEPTAAPTEGLSATSGPLPDNPLETDKS